MGELGWILVYLCLVMAARRAGFAVWLVSWGAGRTRSRAITGISSPGWVMGGIAGRDGKRQAAADAAATSDPEAGLVDMVMAAADDDPTLDEDSRLLLLSVLSGDEDLEAGLKSGAA